MNKKGERETSILEKKAWADRQPAAFVRHLLRSDLGSDVLAEAVCAGHVSVDYVGI